MLSPVFGIYLQLHPFLNEMSNVKYCTITLIFVNSVQLGTSTSYFNMSSVFYVYTTSLTTRDTPTSERLTRLVKSSFIQQQQQLQQQGAVFNLGAKTFRGIYKRRAR